MYYEEKMINGIMHWRTSPDAEFVPYDIKELSARYANAKNEIKELRSDVEAITSVLRTTLVKLKGVNRPGIWRQHDATNS